MRLIETECKSSEHAYLANKTETDIFQRYETAEIENSQIMKRIAIRIRELEDEKSERSSRSSSRSSHATYRGSSKRSEAEAKAAELKAKLKYIDVEAKAKLELEKIQTMRELETAKAKLEVLDGVSKVCSESVYIKGSLPQADMLNTFLESTIKFPENPVVINDNTLPSVKNQVSSTYVKSSTALVNALPPDNVSASNPTKKESLFYPSVKVYTPVTRSIKLNPLVSEYIPQACVENTLVSSVVDPHLASNTVKSQNIDTCRQFLSKSVENKKQNCMSQTGAVFMNNTEIQSDATFVLDETRRALGLSGTDVKLSLSTMHAENHIFDSRKIKGLVVRGFDSELKLPLPNVFSRFILPANRILDGDRINVHLFGAASSPGCANFGLKRVADDYEDEFGSDTYVFQTFCDFYADDGLKSFASVYDAVSLIK
ncbi:unnamed protein product [Mytilus coruscus]|uniref:Uncharacterized protein n=1 Tax=Mytilus coruscus TaxID=42192 RepID=A0A6J8EXY9_MYTCO|nr:unnamed protein product [Mytilus coruscus]